MEIIIAILGLLVAILTFWYSFYRKPKEELEHFIVQFKSTQSISKQLQIELESFIQNANCGSEEMFRNITFDSYLEELKESYQQNLSDKLLEKVTNTNPTKSIILSMTRSLENQFNEIQKILIEIRIRNKELK
ncbi:MAG: hypothetical protein AAF717_08765 [Bacteroidota bacterium]